MPRRSGGFGGVGLDPFGAGGGSLSRYNMGETVSSLEALEAYTIALGWQNGTVSDDEYLASLLNQVTLAAPGSKEKLSAQDKYDDAVYTIARNKIVNQINAAPTSSERISLMQKLIVHDEARLKVMDPANEQTRELATKIAGARADVRQTKYGDMVEKVNRGSASSSDLLALAQRFYAEAAGDPDVDSWRKSIGELRDRISDEHLTDAFQDYQHNRITGARLLSLIDDRMGELEKGSPAYRELANQREDLKDQLVQKDRALTIAKTEKARNAGKITDAAYIAALRDDLAKTEPGTQDRVEAENRLRQASFSLAEDKLRYDVQKGKAGAVNRLVSFYRTYQATMNPGSAEFRTLDLAIDSLKGRGSGGGGRKPADPGGPSAKGFIGGASVPKIIGVTGDFVTLASGEAGIKVPKDLVKLLGVNPEDKAQMGWFDKNQRSMYIAQQNGDDTWVFFDQKGKPTTLPYTPNMMMTLDRQAVGYAQVLVNKAPNRFKAQVAIGNLITALDQYRDHGGAIAMDDYSKNMGLLKEEKQRALASGDYALYADLAFAQQGLVRSLLMLPDGVPTDVAASQNPMLTEDQRGRLATDLDAIEPAVYDPQDAELGYHPKGDPVLAAIVDGSIRVTDRDGDGKLDTSEADPYRGYRTQDPVTGQVAYVKLDAARAGDYYTATDPITGAQTTKPSYLNDMIHVETDDGDFFQPKQEGGLLSFSVRVIEDTTPTSTVNTPAQGATYGAGAAWGGGSPAAQPRPVTPGNQHTYLAGTIDLNGVAVRERGEDGKDHVVWWVTLDGLNYLRVDAGAGGTPPQLVINPDKTGRVKMVNNSLTIDGEAYDPKKHGTELSKFMHFYGTGYWGADGKYTPAPEGNDYKSAAWGIGAPGQFFEVRKLSDTGALVTTHAPELKPTQGSALLRLRANAPGSTVSDDAETRRFITYRPVKEDLELARGGDALARARRVEAETASRLNYGSMLLNGAGNLRSPEEQRAVARTGLLSQGPAFRPRPQFVIDFPRDMAGINTPKAPVLIPKAPMPRIQTLSTTAVRNIPALDPLTHEMREIKPKPKVVVPKKAADALAREGAAGVASTNWQNPGAR